MVPCHVVEITTPKKFVLNGLWFGPKRPKKVVIWIHGLSSTMFGKLEIIGHLVNSKTAVLAFNNRGHDQVHGVARILKNRKGYVRKAAGGAHEVFTDCADDIRGTINFVRRQRVKDIYLAGHSTGCQKSTYWAHKNKGGHGVKGIVLLAPMSDYAAAVASDRNGRLAEATRKARALVQQGKKHELLPTSVWSPKMLADAQRFLSLYVGRGPEEIFTYWDAKKNPKTLKSVKVPLLVLLAEKDEYGDRPAKKIAAWFEEHLRVPHRIVVVPRVPHSFKGGEAKVAVSIKSWMAAR